MFEHFGHLLDLFLTFLKQIQYFSEKCLQPLIDNSYNEPRGGPGGPGSGFGGPGGTLGAVLVVIEVVASHDCC